MDIPLLGSVEDQSELARVGEELKKIMEPHLYVHYRPYTDFQTCRKIDKGKYGEVCKVRERKTAHVYALKKVEFEKGKLIPIGVQREISMLRNLQHKNIVKFFDIVGGPNVEIIYFLMEFCEDSLAKIMKNMDLPFVQAEAKCILKQLGSALEYIHDQGVIHLDVNPTNILMKDTSVLKLCDFSSSVYTDSKPLDPTGGIMWYRAPELLLKSHSYTTAVDIWACGCIFAELLTLRVLFPGKNEIDQISLLIDLLGTPNEDVMPGFNKLSVAKEFSFKIQPYNFIRKRFRDLLKSPGIAILHSMLSYGQEFRITARELLLEKYFEDEPPACTLEDLKYGIIHKKCNRA